MRQTLLSAALVLALAVPAVAAPHAAAPAATSTPAAAGLPIRLAATSTPAPWFTSGVVAGRFGGVPVIGSFTGTAAIGILTLTVHGATFAYGGYACFRRACSFSGLVAGVRVRALPLPLNIRGTAKAAAGAFPTPSSWLGAVTAWARQHLTREQERRILAEAAKALRS